MKRLILLFFIAPCFLFAQEEPFRIVDQKPVLRKCLQVANILEQEQCTNQGILSFIFQNVVYPDTAIAQGIEGTVVSEIVIGKDGTVKSHNLVRDIGAGCGEEISRVLEELTKVRGFWSPAVKDGKAVDYVMTLPVKFKIPEPAPPAEPFKVYGPDTIYHQYSTSPMYGASIQDMEKLLLDELQFPKGFEDSCFVGTMVAQVVISKAGDLRILELIDYEDLGIDFQFKFIELLNSTTGKWTPAIFGEKSVHALHNIRAVFSPSADGCVNVASLFASANEMARQGEINFANEQMKEALENWGKAIDLFPNNAEFRLLRGQTTLENGINPEQTCEDLSIAKQNITLDPILAASLPLICLQAQADSTMTIRED